MAQLHERGAQYRLGIEHLENLFGFYSRLPVMQRRHHPGHAVITKRNQHPPANHRLLTGNPVGKRHVQRDRQGDVTKLCLVHSERSEESLCELNL